MGEHLTADGKFKSDKYEWCPPGFLPLKFTDPMAQQFILEYASVRRVVDASFSDDVEEALKNTGFKPSPPLTWEEAYNLAKAALKLAQKSINRIAGWSGSSGNWPLQEASGIVMLCLDLFKENKKRENVPLYIPYTPENRTALEAIRTYCAVQKSCCSDKKLFEAFDSIEEQIKFLLDR